MTIEELAKALGVSQPIAQLLIGRGLDTVEKAKAFLYPTKEDMLPASSIAQMEDAAKRIRQAIDEGEKILIFGDYDCDGICATSILTLYLRKEGADVEYFIPRREDGYGLSEQQVERVVGTYYPDLLITVDCGITSCAEVEYAMDLGVDVIVTDHHEPQEDIPECIVVNPKLGNEPALASLCGAGVALKLVEALSDRETANEYLDICALATVADVVPLLGENRIIVKYGLELINSTPRAGIAALVKSCELSKVTSTDIGFRIAPRINALGRVNDDADVVSLFVSDEPFVIREMVNKVASANTERQNRTNEMVKQAYQQLQSYDLMTRRAIVLYDERWEPGMLGLVASRITQEFFRPTIILTNVGGTLKGSARSIPGVNIFQTLQCASQFLTGFGGHSGAAGMSMLPANLRLFTEELCHILDAYDDSVFVPKLDYDLVIQRDTVTKGFFKELAMLEPFGEGNPVPKLMIDTADLHLQRVGTAHVKCKLNSDAELMAFNSDYLMTAESMDIPCTLVTEASERTFANRDYIQLTPRESEIAGVETMRDSALAFGTYLKTILFAPKEVGIRTSTVDKEISHLKGTRGTLFIAYSKEGVDAFLGACKAQGKLHLIKRYAVGEIQENPLNTLLIAPTSCANMAYFSSIVFVEAPLSKGYLANVGAHAPSPELVICERYAFMTHVKSVSLDVDRMQIALRLIGTAHVKNLTELVAYLVAQGVSTVDAYAHFYICYELGNVKVGDGFALSVANPTINVDASRVYKTLDALKRR